MKSSILLTIVFLSVFSIRADVYQEINLGSIPGSLIDSEGNELDGTFTAQLGTFGGAIDPTTSNTDQWELNWKLFAEDPISNDPGANFQLSANILVNNGDSDVDGYSSDASADAYDFSNQQAWLWVKNGTDIEAPGTEWFLARISSWIFPAVSLSDCCPGPTAINWSLTQLNDTEEFPVWGSQDEWEGGGEASINDSGYNLQTHAIPEPGTWVMMGMAISVMGAGVFFRRRYGVRK